MQISDLAVVCLNFENYLGLGSVYVSRLQRMVDRHLTIPHKFVEITEHELPKGRIGWFNKLSLLEMFDGEVLYLDLDMVISGNIDHLIDIARSDKSKIWARDDWSYPVTKPRPGLEATINSSVLIWNGRKDMSGAEERIPKTHGDQGIITQLFWPDGIGLLPNDSIKSYKYDAMRGNGHGPICVMHGSPKNHEILDEWVVENWR